MKNTLRTILAAVAFTALPLPAATLQYWVTVNTASLSSFNPGEIDLELVPGVPAPFAVQLTATNFTDTANLGPTEGGYFDGYAGSLANTLILDNSGTGGGYYRDYTFGNTFNLLLTFDGAGVPGNDSPSETVFRLLLAAPGGDPLYPSGNPVVTITFSPDTGANVSFDESVASVQTFVPEPSTLILLGSAGVILFARRRYFKA